MNTCPNCNAPVEPDHRFCMECGYKIETAPELPQEPQQLPQEPEPAVEEMVSVENHIMWNMQPGQVARLINEKEFAQYSDAAGLIVNEGARVLIRKNAEELTMLSSGVYQFPKRPVPEGSSRGFMTGLLRTAAVKDAENVPLELFSILLVRDGDFPVIFGGADSTGDDFRPMVIPAKNLEVEVGVSAMLRISSMQVFASKYMSDRSRLNVPELVKMLSPKVERVLRDVLADVFVSEGGIPEVVQVEIKDRLAALSAELGGVSISNVEEIRVGHEALERFRALNSELYLTGRELEYLERTNEFRNRLAAAQNAQQVNEAASELELYRRLQEINKDKVLADDELERFYTVLSREKRIREAQSEDQVAAALADIERTGLIRSEDLNALKDDIRANEHRRGHAFRMMQKKDELELESLQREYEKRVRDEDYEFEKRKKDDEFDRFKELERMRSEKEAAEHDRNMEALREMQRAKLEKLKLSKELTPEQLLALAANENLSPEAAAKLAESLGKGREVEAERARMEEIQRLTQARIEDMKEMSRMSQETVREFMHASSPHPYPVQPQAPVQQAAPAQQPGAGHKFCTACGYKNAPEARFCMSCGNPMN
ncbi:MAG: hypothetical protein IJN02_02300 [Bacteroidales bacterium]|nr:hypothetical protein [Bacteroidales bacterium]